LSSSAREITCPGRCTSASRSSYSFGDSSTGRPFFRTTRATGWISMSPNREASDGGAFGLDEADARRSTASTRATNSRTPNGFVT
jgi:hypothetical protein